jgi:hypothetical protein
MRGRDPRIAVLGVTLAADALTAALLLPAAAAWHAEQHEPPPGVPYGH